MTNWTEILVPGLPAPATRFAGMPRLNLVGGHNDPDLVPIEELARTAQQVITREGHNLALYNLGEGPMGHPPLRRFVADKLEGKRGAAVDSADILITSGSLQGLDLVNAALLEPGDTVLMEELTYSGAIERVRRRGVRIVGVPLDGEGLRIDRLEAALEELAREGIRPKYLYTIPTIQNPTGTVLSLERRHALLRLAAAHGVPVVEDECYADLLWEGPWPPALRGLPGGEQVIHIGSFSKSLAPALRLGYLTAPWPVLARLLSLKNDGGTAALEQMIVADYFSRHFDAHIVRLKTGLAAKLDLLVTALAEEFGTTAELSPPKGGIFLWVTLPPNVDTSRLAREALARGLAFNSGREWAIEPARGASSLRLCFARPPATALCTAVAELAALCHEMFGVPERGGNRPRAS